MNIGIIGLGYVGKAIKDFFQKKDINIKTYDKFIIESSNVDNLKDLVMNTKVIFICVPTPMNEDGSCHTDIVEEVVSDINSLSIDFKRAVLIKSTVPPGTTFKLNQKNKNIDVMFNPEFLTEANFINDFVNQNRIIIGSDEGNFSVVNEIYKKCFPSIPIINTNSKTAEMVKYLTNTFLATKVSFANEMKSICDKLNIDYQDVINYSLYDSRLGDSHWNVPGPDGKDGFGGSCFPKDINSLITLCKNNDIDPKILQAAWDKNLTVRSEKDWEKLKGRAIVGNNKK